MKLFRAIYNTEAIKGINYDFNAENTEKAVEFCDRYFTIYDIKIVELDAETLEEIKNK